MERIRWIVMAVVMVLVSGCLLGCQPDIEPLERTSMLVLDKVVIPVVNKGITESNIRTATLQGNVYAIEPGWEMEFEGFLVQGVKGKMVLKARGVSGGLSGHGQADNAATRPAVE